MSSTPSRYRCRACGSASYQRLTHRTASGAMGYSGLFRCSGCSRTFERLQQWHDGGDPAALSGSALQPAASSAPPNP